MPWIESHTAIADHPKTRKLARQLGVSIVEAVGHLHLLWWWAIEYAEDGNLSSYDADDIAIGARFDGDAETFVGALVAVDFIDRTDNGLELHDWWDYAGRFIAARRASADAGSFGNHQRWHVSRGVTNPTCPHCAGGSGGESGGESGSRRGAIAPTQPTVPTSPTTTTGDETKKRQALKKRLDREGFSAEAVEHALGRLGENDGQVTSPLAWCRKVAANYSTEQADKESASVERERIAACGRCNDNGHFEHERDDGSLELERCDHEEVAS